MAVSAEMERFPLMISVNRLAGILRARAAALAESPTSSSSRFNILPGWIGGRLAVLFMIFSPLVIIHDFNLIVVPVAPFEAAPVLVIDPDAVLPLSIAGQLF